MFTISVRISENTLIQTIGLYIHLCAQDICGCVLLYFRVASSSKCMWCHGGPVNLRRATQSPWPTDRARWCCGLAVTVLVEQRIVAVVGAADVEVVLEFGVVAVVAAGEQPGWRGSRHVARSRTVETVVRERVSIDGQSTRIRLRGLAAMGWRFAVASSRCLAEKDEVERRTRHWRQRIGWLAAVSADAERHIVAVGAAVVVRSDTSSVVVADAVEDAEN